MYRALVRRLPILAVTLLPASSLVVAGQSVAVTTAAGALHVQAPEIGFIQGPIWDRLRDGRSVRLDFDLAVLEKPGGATVAETHQTVTLSFDLWEERIAVTRAGTPPRAISHLSAKDAEAWCLQQLTIPVAALGRLGGGTPFWIRLTYRARDIEPVANESPDDGFTIARLIDRLSRRGRQDEISQSLEAGPFRVSS